MDDLLLIILILIIPLFAEIYVKSNFSRYRKRANKKAITGQEVAKMILEKNGLKDIYVVATNGTLTDHYDPRRKVVRLSKDIYEGTTVASLAIAAHECGHAIQDKENYLFLRIRSLIFPLVNVATSISYIIIVIGFIFEMLDLVYIGIGLTSLGLIFQIITLPVEFNASSRAKEELKKLNITEKSEDIGVKAMLNSAALTYVAGVLASALQILRLILIAKDNN